MQLNIDGKIIQAEPEQSLKALVAKQLLALLRNFD